MPESCVIRAFDADHVVELTGLTKGQLRYWDKTGFFKPEFGSMERTPFAHIYSFQNVVGLRTVSILRKKFYIPLQQLRKVALELSRHRNEPWSQLTLYVLGKAVYFKEPSTGVVQSALEGQTTLIQLKSIMEDVADAANKLRERRPDQIGRLEKNRYVVHNAFVVAGTRVPIATIKRFHEAGYTSARIIREYPNLKKEDVEAALRHEVKQARRA